MLARTQWVRNLMLLAPVSCVGVWACFNAPVETPMGKVTQETDVRVEQDIKNKVDLLFLIDDSPSMAPKQAELKARFPELIKVLDDFGKANPAWYHIGVVTSDLGAGNFTLGGGQCQPGGRGGKLQPVGAGAAASCVAPTRGLNFIDYNQLMPDASGVPDSNLPPGQDLAQTFGCMASVGDKGCGFEHQLEAVYRALHDKPAENHDFLRPEALLVVVWVTDEDDCSIDAMNGQDLFDPAKTMQYGALLSYRCTEYGIQCTNPATGMVGELPYGDSGGTWTNCSSQPPSAGGKLADINKYINFFSTSAGTGGVKVDPADVILVGISASASAGISSLLANPSPVPPGPYTPCPGPIGTSCGVVLQHSCISPTNSQFFGDPAVRLNQVISSAKNNQLTSICDTSYQSALQNLGQLIVSNIGAGCITSPLEDPMKPDCIVEDITHNQDGTTTVTEIPWCGNNHEVPATCWQLQAKPDKCAAVYKPGDPTAQQYGIQIDRGGQQPPAATTARVACSTIAIPKM
jgi:hypothetical protein